MTKIASKRFRALFALSLAAIAASTSPAADAATPVPAKAAHACALLSKADVRKLAPWPDFLDQFPVEEDAIATGSGCNYPSVYIQVMTTNDAAFRSTLAAFKNPTLERIDGVGDEAFLRDNRGDYAELLARVGPFMFTTQHNLEAPQGRTLETVKSEVIAVGQALATKLR